MGREKETKIMTAGMGRGGYVLFISHFPISSSNGYFFLEFSVLLSLHGDASL
jgi:hypothetical protein